MIAIINSSKTLEFNKPAATRRYTLPEFIDDAAVLVGHLRAMTPASLGELMGISEKLARQNADRYARWKTPFDLSNAKQALAAFSGDVYAGLEVATYSIEDFDYAQSHIRILSGLYGILRPLDLIQPYRLEMATPLKTPHHQNLYAFWGDRLTHALERLLQSERSNLLINLASAEYGKVLELNRMNVRVVTPIFREIKDGKSRTVAIYTKKARGLLSGHIIRNRVTDIDGLKNFRRNGYHFNPEQSAEDRLVFERRS